MKRCLVFAFVIGALVLGACGGKATVTPGTFESPLTTPGAGIANPASTFCGEQGYTLEIRTSPDGSQAGYCVFPDGTECDEWAFYRNECGPGTPKP